MPITPYDPLKQRPLGGAGASAPAGAAPQQNAMAPAQAQATPQQPQQAQQQPGTGFVNLQRVLEANRAGAQQMGTQLAGQVREKGEAAKQAVNTAQGAYTAALAAKAPTFDAAKLPAAAPGGARGDVKLQAMQAQQAEAAKLGAMKYEGPKDWEAAGVDVPGLTLQATKASDAAKAVTSAGGRAALMREQSPNLTVGGANLDGFLAGQGMGAQAQELNASFGGLPDLLKAGREQGQKDYQKAMGEAEGVAKKYSELAAGLGAGLVQERADQRERSWKAKEPERQRAEEKRRRDDGVLEWDEQERMRDRKRGNRGGED